jgi:dUTP pyrophosphatase
MIIKIKKLVPEAVVPKYAKDGDACVDLVATSINFTNKYIEYGTGIAMEIPEGHVGLIYPRSSVTNKDLMLKNSVGVIDSGYRGEIRFRFTLLAVGDRFNEPEIYNIGERIGQIMIIPCQKMQFEEIRELSTTERGEGGYGSSGL